MLCENLFSFIKFIEKISSPLFYSRKETEIKYLLFPLFQWLQGVTSVLRIDWNGSHSHWSRLSLSE